MLWYIIPLVGLKDSVERCAVIKYIERIGQATQHSKLNIIKMKTTILTTLTLPLLLMATALGAQEGDTPQPCKRHVLPKVAMANRTTETLQKLTIVYKVDGTDKGSSQWEGELPPYHSTVLALPPLPLIRGMNTFSIYIEGHTENQLVLDWADHEAQERQVILSENPIEGIPEGEPHTDDCNCLRSAEEGLPQVNLWVHATGSDEAQVVLNGSVDKGIVWVAGVRTSPEEHCSDVELTVQDSSGSDVRLLIDQEGGASTSIAQTQPLGGTEDVPPLGRGSGEETLTVHPNPFEHATTLRYSLSSQGEVELVLYDLLGKQVAILMDGQQQKEGLHEFVFRPKGIAKGLYLLTLTTEQGSRTKRIIIK